MGESLGYDPVVSRLALFYLTLTFLLEMPHSNLAWKTNVKNAKPSTAKHVPCDVGHVIQKERVNFVMVSPVHKQTKPTKFI